MEQHSDQAQSLLSLVACIFEPGLTWLGTAQERKAWENDFLEHEVVASTGPWMLTDALKEHLHIRARSAGEYIRPTGEVILQGKHQPPLHLNEVRPLLSWLTYLIHVCLLMTALRAFFKGGVRFVRI